MAREPDWYRLGYEIAGGRKKSTMNIPENFFIDQVDKMFRNDFNTIKFCYDYAIAWLETEQWKLEVGQKIKKYVKKFKDDDKRVDEFMKKSFQWADGYSISMLNNFVIMWENIPHSTRSQLSDDSLYKLVKQALYVQKGELK